MFLVHFLQHPPGGVNCKCGGHCSTGQAFLTHVSRLPLHWHLTHGSSVSVTSRSSNTFCPFKWQPAKERRFGLLVLRRQATNKVAKAEKMINYREKPATNRDKGPETRELVCPKLDKEKCSKWCRLSHNTELQLKLNKSDARSRHRERKKTVNCRCWSAPARSSSKILFYDIFIMNNN